MSYAITHFFAGGTQAQYETALAVVHPDHGLPKGQHYHAAGPTEGGWLVIAVWDSQESCDTYLRETLMPAMAGLEGGFPGPPEERRIQVVNEVTA